jgi:hypothetical protein
MIYSFYLESDIIAVGIASHYKMDNPKFELRRGMKFPFLYTRPEHPLGHTERPLRFLLLLESKESLMGPEWLRRYATSREVPGSIPGRVTGDYFFPKHPTSPCAPGVDSASKK